MPEERFDEAMLLRFVLGKDPTSQRVRQKVIIVLEANNPNLGIITMIN